MNAVKWIPKAGLLTLLFTTCSPNQETVHREGLYKPWESLGDLFKVVQLTSVFEDSKTFLDCTPKSSPAELVKRYDQTKDNPDFNLSTFIADNFELPAIPETDSLPPSESFEGHLKAMWDVLTRKTNDQNGLSTLISLPGAYVVPGGRFREIYYWDSYFTMIGLGASGRVDLAELMVSNMASLIDTIGHVPNGNRSYYLSRSQPPYFSQMVDLLGKLTSDEQAIPYLPMVQKEYDFWMQGANSLEPSSTHLRVVKLPDGMILNRYYDFLDTPRPESYKEDLELAEGLPPDQQKKLYRNLRAGAESGWDYSTRWFEDKTNFESIRILDILPVDLNCLLYAMEGTLARLYALTGQHELEGQYTEAQRARRKAILEYFWEEDQGAFTDYIWTEQQHAEQVTMATAYPLYFKVATEAQGAATIQYIKENLLLTGGLVATQIASGQQWDFPNGWAPLQWLGIKGMEHYGEGALAQDVAQRWLKLNQAVYRRTGKMMEKYNVADTTLTAGGGEYPTQDGFGWTNGIALALMADNAVY